MSEPELLDAVAEAPNDDGPRLVYADFLQQAPDPAQRARGEYISLACTSVRSADRTARMKLLLDKHEHEWLGPCADPTTRRVWTRGFVEACAFAFTWSEDAIGHAMWRTLRLLDARAFASATDPRVEAICQPALRHLRALCISSDFVAPLAVTTRMPEVRELAIDASHPIAPGVPTLARMLADAPWFERVRRFHVTASWTPEVLATLARADRTIAVVAAPARLLRWLEVLEDPAIELDELRLVPELHPLLAREGFELVVRRSDAAFALEVRWTDADDPLRRDAILVALARIPAGRIARLTFVGPDRASFDTARWKTRVRGALRDQPAV